MCLRALAVAYCLRIVFFIRTRRDVHVRDVHDVAVLFTRVFTFAVPLSPKKGCLLTTYAVGHENKFTQARLFPLVSGFGASQSVRCKIVCRVLAGHCTSGSQFSAANLPATSDAPITNAI